MSRLFGVSTDYLLKDELAPAAPEAPVPEVEDKLAACQGREGVAVSALRPGGTVEVDGVRVNAASGGELIAKGAKILVVGREGDHVIVRPAV